MHRWLVGLLVLLALTGASFPRAASAADPLEPKAVPEPLKPWTAWALDGKDEHACPGFQAHADLSRCVWPSRLDLALGEHGGRFTQRWHLDAKVWVPLPGDAKRWPSDVKKGGAAAVVIDRSGAPSVLLDRGETTLTGAFAWDALPESIRVPPETGLLALVVRGVPVASPNRDADGTVWLQKAATNQEGDSLEVAVHRKVTDGIPLTLTTRIELHVAGKNREELLGKALPAGFVPLSMDSALPARIEPDGHVRVQVRAGAFVIEIAARSTDVVRTLARPDPGGPWRDGDEIWVFEANPDDRVVTVEGVPSIDPQQTTLPEAWKRFPAYPMGLGSTLSLIERRRGDADPPPDQLTLARTLWLEFDGAGYTVSDALTGTLNHDSRLTMLPPTVLGRVSIGDRDQFITRMDDPSNAGVEVRQGELLVKADSRIPGDPRDIPAVGWAHDFHKMSATLNLPPGWRLLHASGVDEVEGTWIRGWTLLEIFLALVVSISLGRLYGAGWGVVAAVTLVLTLPEGDAPKWSWLLVLAAEALVRVLPVGRFKQLFSVARLAAILFVIAIALPFAVDQVRVGLYPVLELPGSPLGEDRIADREAGELPPPAPPAPPAGEPHATGAGAAAAAAAPKPDLEALMKDELSQRAAPPPSRGPPSSTIVAVRKGEPENGQVYDPTAIVQTGPGLPRWRWKSFDLKWSGPVTASQRLHFYLLPPFVNTVLGLARALLLFVLVLRLFPWTEKLFSRRAGGIAAAALLLFGAPSVARADLPPQEMLDELSARLLRAPECSPACASSDRMSIDVRAGVLRARLDVEAAAPTAIPLPGSTAQWTPAQVLLDGTPAKALARINDALWIEIPKGRSQVSLEGPVAGGESMQLALLLKPHRVEVASAGWTVTGVHEDGLADDVLELTRVRTEGGGGAGASLQPGTLPPFVRVERTLQVGINWQVDTHVFRLTPVGSAVVLEVPLLPGESVTTADVRVEGRKALVNLAPQATEVAWHSVLEQKSPVKLEAPKSIAWFEVWRADVSPIWDATYTGIPLVRTASASGARRSEWRPWPGERAQLDLVRPEGVPGQTLTIDATTMDMEPGVRATDVTLVLDVRSSRGAEHTFTLPPGAQLESLAIQAVPQPIRQDGRMVTVPLVPGAETVVLKWRETPGMSAFFTSPAVDVGAPSVNAASTIQVPDGRWVLFVGGPRAGPAVLFWGLLAILLAVSLALGRSTWTAVRGWQWFLLAFGLSQVSVVAGGVFVGWLFALGYRERQPGEGLGVAVFNLRQALLVVWTLVALGILAGSIYQGLLGSPEMQVSGNGSSSMSLHWFADRAPATLPGAWVFSVPLMVYRGAMLAWALWIALALLRWLRWGWSAFTTGGAWKKRPPRPKPVTPAPPVAPPA